MRKGVVLVSAALLSGGCTTADRSFARLYAHSEVMAARDELEGQNIRVSGWLGGCQPQDNRICGLYSDERKARSPEPLEWPLPVRFADEAASLDVRHVIVRGRYVFTCKPSDTVMCPDYDGYLAVDSIED